MERALSAVVLVELQAGVLATAGVAVRARRMATLNAVADIEVVEIDEPAALMWAHMRVHLAQSGRRCNVDDLWIAARAASRGWAVVTRDDDFEPVAGVGGLQAVRV